MLLSIIGALVMAWSSWATNSILARPTIDVVEKSYVTKTEMLKMKEEIIGEIHSLRACILREDC